MKKVSIVFLLLNSLLNGCKKGNDTLPVSEQQPAESVNPVAAFRISNLTSQGLILEANITDFDNQSQNADSYFWDFGNGISSVEKIPKNIAFYPCGGINTISLTVKNKKAVSATYSQTFTILCRGKNNGGRHLPITEFIHVNAVEMPAFMQRLN